MPEVFISAILVIGTILAVVESFRAWGFKGPLAAIAVIAGLFGLAYKFAIPGGAIIPLVAALVIFRKAQTARMMSIALEDEP